MDLITGCAWDKPSASGNMNKKKTGLPQHAEAALFFFTF